VTISPEGSATLTLSAAALNRLFFSEPIVSAYTASESIEVVLERQIAVITFRTPRPAEVLVLTQSGQYMLRLLPHSALPAQSVRIRQAKPDTHLTSSYTTQLADLIQAGYRRIPPEGFRIERPARTYPPTSALAWHLTLQFRGHALTVQELAVANRGAFAHSIDPAEIAPLFPNAGAVSSDPLMLAHGAWGRVLLVVDTNTLDPPEITK